MCSGLQPKPKPGVEDDAFEADAGGRPPDAEALGEAGADVDDDIVVGAAALVVHGDEGGAGAGDDPCHRGVGAQAADVVDGVGAQAQGLFGHAGVVGVD